MEYPEDFTINCSRCESSHTDVVPLGSAEWLVTCQDCFGQSTVSDEELERSRQAGHMEIKGRPLGSSGADTQEQKTNSVVRNAELRAGKTQVENPLIRNAERRAKTHKMEVHHV
jgi:hypothetical protein